MSTEEERVWFLAVPGNPEPQGPYTWGQLERGLSEGKLRPEDQCCRKGMTSWISLAQARDLSKTTSEWADEAVAGAVRPPRKRRGTRSVVGLVVKVSIVLALIGGGIYAYKSGRATETATILKDSLKSSPLEEAPLEATESEASSKLIANVKDLEEEASGAMESGDFAKARECCEQIAENGGASPELAEEVDLANRRLSWIELTENPEIRFGITGVTIGVNTVLMIRDKRDGINHRVKEGDAFAEYKLESYDAENKSAQISAEGRVFTIHSQDS